MLLLLGRGRRGWAAILGLVVLESAGALVPLSDWVDGMATYYGGQADGMDPYSPSYGTADGACGYGYIKKNQWPYWSVGALTPGNRFAKANSAHACGECFEIWCQDGSPGGNCNPDPNQRRVTVMISDICEPCSPPGDDHIDLQALTFLKIAPWSGGQIYIKYRRVDCTPPGSIRIELMNVNGDYGWLRLTAQEVGGTGSITAIQVKGPQSDWEGMANKWGAAWEIVHAPTYPLDIHLTNDQGQELTAYQAIFANGSTSADLPHGIQFVVHSTPAPGPGGQPRVTAYSSDGENNPACSDPSVAAFSNDANAQTPQSSNGNLPACPKPPSPPPPPVPALSPPAMPVMQPGAVIPAGPAYQLPVPSPVPAAVPGPVPIPVPVSPVMMSPAGIQPAQYPTPASPALPASPSLPAQPASSAVPALANSPVSPAQPAVPASPALAQGGSPGGPPGCQGYCSDLPPDSQYTCTQQAQFGKCVQPFIMQPSAAAPQGFCALSCQRCVLCSG